MTRPYIALAAAAWLLAGGCSNEEPSGEDHGTAIDDPAPCLTCPAPGTDGTAGDGDPPDVEPDPVFGMPSGGDPGEDIGPRPSDGAGSGDPPPQAGMGAGTPGGNGTPSDTADAAMPGMSTADAGIPDAAPPDASSATGAFPPVEDLAAAGPYTSTVINNTGPDGNYTVYHPQELAPGGVLNPIVTWGNGGATTPVDYPLLPHLASHGFVVVASNNPFVTGPEVKSGLDWLVAQNDAQDSVFYEKLDLERVGGAGYSFGGLATLDNSDDPRYDTVVIISGGSMAGNRASNLAKLRTPAAYFCTDDASSEDNCAGDYAELPVPGFFGVMNDSEHVHVTTFLGLGSPPIITRLNAAVLGWFRWHLMDDQSLRAMFLGDDCGLCQDTNWTVQPPKNWP